jgi:preprotein translocase subunit SecD
MVGVTFTASGTARFEELTKKASEATPPANKVMMLVDGKVVLAPNVMETITGGDLMIPLRGGEAAAKAMAAAITGAGGTQ